MSTLKTAVEVDQSQIQEALSLFQFVGGNIDKAYTIAINKSGKQIRNKATKQIYDRLNVKSTNIKKRIRFVSASRTKLSGKITTDPRGLLLSRFSTDPNLKSNKVTWIKPPPVPKKGIRVKVRRDLAPKLLKGAPGELAGKPFYMVFPSNKVLGIVARKSGGGIKSFYGYSVSQAWEWVRDDVVPEATEVYQKQLLDAMRFVLLKQAPK